MKNPYQILSSKPVYENKWIQVTEHQVIHPTGNPGIYGVVHFKSRAVGVIPFENGSVWLVGQYRFTLSAYSWEIPAGGSSPEEELRQTAERELLEETGFRAQAIEPLVEMHLSNSVSDEYSMVFLARGLSQGDARPDETEKLEVRKISLAQAYDEVCRGEITDSMTVAGILKLRILELEGKLT